MPQNKPNTITLEPPWYRCENGTEFRCAGTPKRCPVCRSEKIEIVVDVAPEFRAANKGGNTNARE